MKKRIQMSSSVKELRRKRMKVVNPDNGQRSKVCLSNIMTTQLSFETDNFVIGLSISCFLF